MIQIEHVDVHNKAQVQRFIELPFRIYANHLQWVPPIISDLKAQMNPNKHPFYAHSEADFFSGSARRARCGAHLCQCE